MKKDEMPHKLQMTRKKYKELVSEGMRLVAIHHEITVWKDSEYYYMYSDCDLNNFAKNHEGIMNSFNDYFNKSNGK